MKKILVLIFALAITLSLASCGEDLDTLGAYIEAVEATNPTETVVDTEVTTVLGKLYSTVKTVYNEDGSSVITYSYEKFNAIGEGADAKSEISGTVNCDKDGKYSGDVSGNVSAAASIKLHLDASLLKDLSFDNQVCSAVVEAANTQAVLGIALNADVNIVIAVSEGKLASMTLAYTDQSGEVLISCSYK